MVQSRRLITGAVGHLALFFLNFCVLVGVIESIQLFDENLPILNALVLAYMLTNAFLLLSVQLGVQVLELIRIRMPTLLIAYYFQLGDDESISIPLLDPTKHKLAVFILLLTITGGPILYPIFAVYGFLLIFAHLVTIVLDPSVILTYFGIFLNWMPPILGIIVAMIIASIVIVEFKHR
ncbi:MAG: hypothetical protein JSW61_00365 [Candidatus Thorarchaeota archaeon]|nr:MAG: hypothetical protein JSW61_00365 [Candidatus Thorarchaeota archaeon]